MAIMFGNGSIDEYNGEKALIMKSEQFIATATTLPTEAESAAAAKVVSGWNQAYTGPDGKVYKKINPKFYDAKGKKVSTLVENEKFFCSFDLKVDGAVIEISANSFPGTYYVTGDTYARSETTGKDEFFQFIVPKAKVQSENTITLEAEGDPSVFNMNLKVLRPADGIMMKLVKYNLTDGADADVVTSTMYHNHVLEVNNMDSLKG